MAAAFPYPSSVSGHTVFPTVPFRYRFILSSPSMPRFLIILAVTGSIPETLCDSVKIRFLSVPSRLLLPSVPLPFLYLFVYEAAEPLISYICLQKPPSFLVIGQNLRHLHPETGRMVHLQTVGQLIMHNHIIHTAVPAAVKASS